LNKQQDLRYGENPHQRAAFYVDWQTSKVQSCSLASMKCFHGKELSYNNMLDMEHAVRLAKEFSCENVFAVIIVKHNTPCGVGISTASIAEAYSLAFEGDPVSPFGGIVCTNSSVTIELAQKLYETFLEVVIAPSFDEEAKEFLQKKKNLRLVTYPVQSPLANHVTMTHVQGGFLVQDANNMVIENEKLIFPTIEKPPLEILKSMEFAMTVVKHVRSNAIAIANGVQTISIAGGFTNRVDAVELAISKAKLNLNNAVLASDAFFPFSDSIEIIRKAGIKYIIQPGGSVQDEAVIQACDKAGIAMVFTGLRHFKH
jgi:phosphoribosylaminoimidazolecarboxamide formyltransferase/IMP cyclohydrolase